MGLITATGTAGWQLALQVSINVAAAGVKGAAGQIGDNLMYGRRWSDDLGRAVLWGAGTAGATGVGSLGLRRFVRCYVAVPVRVGVAAHINTALATQKIARSFRNRRWTADEIQNTIQNGRARRTVDLRLAAAHICRPRRGSRILAEPSW